MDILSYKLSALLKLILTFLCLHRHGGLSADNYLEEMNKNMKCVEKRGHQSGGFLLHFSPLIL